MAHIKHYDVSYVARTPQQSSAPNLVELGPIYGDISWTESLYQPDSIEITAPTNDLEDDLKSRLLDLVALPTEIRIYREGQLIMEGAVIGGSISEDEIQISALAIESYMRYMFITGNKTFSTDQATIAKELVDDWQALDYGDFGIDTSGITTHGVSRDKDYKGSEFPNVYEAVLDLGNAENGFDVWVEPDTRILRLDHPTRGSDKSATVFLERGITSPNIKFSVAPGLVASESFGQAKDTGGNVLTSTQVNTTLRADFGRSGVAESFEDSDQALLDDKTAANLNVRDKMFFIPGPGLIPVSGAEVDDFNPGDTVNYLYDAGIGQQEGQFRVKTKKVSVSEGQEFIEVEFE